MASSRRKRPELEHRELLNPEVVTLAVYLLGGDSKEIDTEDVAVQANKMAPGRFTWRKYKGQINIHIIGACLFDARKKKNGAYLSGTGTNGWLLTEAGLVFAKENIKRVQASATSKDRLSKDERRRRRHEQARIAASDAFKKYATGAAPQITRQEADTVFRLNEYIIGEARQKKVQKIVNAFRDEADVGNAVRFFADLALGESR